MCVNDILERRLRRRERRIESAKKSRRTSVFDGGGGDCRDVGNDRRGDNRATEEKRSPPRDRADNKPATGEKKASPSWIDAMPSEESESSMEMPSGRDKSDEVAEEKEASVPTDRAVAGDGVAGGGVNPAVVNLPHYLEAERLNSLGNSLMHQKQFQNALDTYTLAVNIAPAGPRSHVYYSNRSAAYLSLNMNEHSILDCERSIALIKPAEGGGGGGGYYAKAHSRLGLAYFAGGRYREAVDAYGKSLEMEPNNEWALEHLEKAKARLISSIGGGRGERDKNDAETKAACPDESAANIVPEGKYAEGEGRAENAQEVIAEQLLHELIEIGEGELADDHKNKGNEHMSNKRYEEALHQYDLAIETSPSGPNSYVYYSNRAAAHCYLANYVNATQDCQRSIELNPDYEKAFSRLGLSLFFQGEYEGTILAYEESLKLDPTNKASMSYLKKAKAKLSEQQKEKKAREEEERRASEEQDKMRIRMEWLHQQKNQRQQKQYQVGIAEDENEDGDSQTSAGLASFLTNEVGDNPGPVSAKKGNNQAFDPFATADD